MISTNNAYKIAIVTASHLVDNPRVWKEANALNESGFKVYIFTVWYSSDKLRRDRELINPGIEYMPSFNTISFHRNIPIILLAKTIKKYANFIYSIFKISSIYQLVYLPLIQLKKIVRYEVDMYICHQEAGLILGNELIKKNYKVAFDFEDYYSEDYLNKYRSIKLLKKHEALALKKAKYISCPSVSIKKTLEISASSACSIHVVYNSFPKINTNPSIQNKISNSLVWFSQTIGPGRGLEQLFDALKQISVTVNLFLIGNVTESYKINLLKEVQRFKHSITFIPPMSHHSLQTFLSQFKIGLALELPQPLSRNLTITNKLLLYLQLKLKIIASDTVGQLELKEYFPNQISYTNIYDSLAFANVIQSEILNQSLEDSFDLNKKFTWDSSKQTIVKIVRDSLAN